MLQTTDCGPHLAELIAITLSAHRQINSPQSSDVNKLSAQNFCPSLCAENVHRWLGARWPPGGFRSVLSIFEGPALVCLAARSPAFKAIQQRGSAALAEEVYDEPPVNSKDGKVLHPDLINPDMKKTVYAVRGELMQRGEELRKAGREIIFTNSTCCAEIWRSRGSSLT